MEGGSFFYLGFGGKVFWMDCINLGLSFYSGGRYFGGGDGYDF